MGNKSNKGQRSYYLMYKHRAWMSLLLLIVSYWGVVQTAKAQTTVTRYLNMNSYVIPFETLVAPLTLSTVSAFGTMKYNAEVTSAQVSWSAVPDADQYQLMLYDATAAQWNLVYDGSGHYFEIDNLPTGVRYFSVVACGGGLCGDYSPNAALLIEDNLDKDLDGVEDEYDLCLGTVEGATVSAAGCVPVTDGSDNDFDDDGITNDLDWCPETVAGESVDSRGCSQDQIDSDGDGVADYLDAYPHQSATQCAGV